VQPPVFSSRISFRDIEQLYFETGGTSAAIALKCDPPPWRLLLVLEHPEFGQRLRETVFARSDTLHRSLLGQIAEEAWSRSCRISFAKCDGSRSVRRDEIFKTCISVLVCKRSICYRSRQSDMYLF
jgi:hypothetical protein